MINWFKRNTIWFIVISLFLIVFSFCLGLLIRDWPFIVVNYEFKITDVLSVLVTFVLALLVPFYIKYFIDKGSKVNEMVLNEASRYRDHLEFTHQRFTSIFQSQKITDSNKTELNVLCEIFDAKYETLKMVLIERCKNGGSEQLKPLTKHHISFWKALTNVEINSNQISTIHPETFTKEVKCYQDISESLVRINLFVTSY